MKVLIADDDWIVRAELEHQLRNRGADVVPAADGDDAHSALLAHPSFDLIVLDLLMPKGGAIAFGDVLEVRHPHTPVVVVSGMSCFVEAELKVQIPTCCAFIEKRAEIGEIASELIWIANERRAKHDTNCASAA